MTEDGPTCSLGPRDLEQRLEAIGQLCDESLIAHSEEGSHHTLRFRPEEGVRQRLEDLVRAEAECCPFLNFALSEEDGELLLSYDSFPTNRKHQSC